MTTNFNNFANEEEEYDNDQFIIEEEEEGSNYSASGSARPMANQDQSSPLNNQPDNNLNQNANDPRIENANTQNSYQQQDDQLISFEEEDIEEDTKEIQLQEVSTWRKQTQQTNQQQKPAKSQNTNPNVTFNNNNDEKFIEASDHHFNSDNIPDDESLLREKFQQFMEEKKHKCVLYLDESRVNLLPAQLRPPIQKIINTIKRLTARNPTGAPLSALQILAERLDEFLELQNHRADRDYDLRCRDLLSIIYRNTIEAQRLSRQLRDAAAPRSLDEYENY